jgi:hypothetical protein
MNDKKEKETLTEGLKRFFIDENSCWNVSSEDIALYIKICNLEKRIEKLEKKSV